TKPAPASAISPSPLGSGADRSVRGFPGNTTQPVNRQDAAINSRPASARTQPQSSLHRLLHQFRLSLGEHFIGCLTVDRLAPDLQHYGDWKRGDVIERFMNDSALDAREHFAEPPDVEEAGRGVGACRAQ